MFDRIGGLLGLAFYAAQAVAMGGGFVVGLVGGDMDAWLAWMAPPMIALGVALVIGLPAVGAAMALWRVMTDMEYGNG